MKKIAFMGLLLTGMMTAVQAAGITKDDTVAVMDFGKRSGATSSTLNVDNVGYAAGDYIVEGLVSRKCFHVVEKETVLSELQGEDITSVGLIDPKSARRIGERLHVRYIIYGNVAGVTLSESSAGIAGSHMVRARIVARIMDVETGDIIMVASGFGSSRSNSVSGPFGLLVNIGTQSVTMESVHNAVAKAADDAAEKIAARCGIRMMKKK